MFKEIVSFVIVVLIVGLLLDWLSTPHYLANEDEMKVHYCDYIVVDKNASFIGGNKIVVKNDTIYCSFRCYDILYEKYLVGDIIGEENR